GAAPAGKQAADTLDPTRKLAAEPKTVVADSGRARQAAAAPDGSPTPAASAPAGRREGPVPAAPSTRRLARELSVDLRTVSGSGPGGRVTDDDVRAAAGAAEGASTAPPARVAAPERAATE